jgi:FtsP/CotA-like multicopper oxidase with cupredoxin domain
MGMISRGSAFTIDRRGFDPQRVDQTVAAGSVEEWTITNTSSMDHPFHLHVWPMQVLSIAGRGIDPPTWQNVVNVPARSSSVVRIAFDDHTGRTVYHCHILDHEDNGMMGVIEVA